jgi:hypothetical protein
MMLSASNAQLISLPTGIKSVVLTTSYGFTLVRWNAVQWSNGAGQPSNVQYDIFIWPAGNPAPAFNLAAPCGIDAFNTASPGVVYTVVDSVQKNISALDPSVTYTVAVKATCPASACMPANLPSMSVAYIPATAQRLITATPSPMSTPSPASPKKPLAGPIIGWLIFTFVVLGGGYFGYRRWRAGGFAAWGLGGGSTSYSRFAMQPSSSSAQAGADDGTLYAKL